MHAIRQHTFGPAENLAFEEVPDPEPGAGQVRIAVSAAGVHVVDTTIRSGLKRGPFPLPALPMTPGREVAGVVTALGADVDPVWLGGRVVAHLGQASGGYAEVAVANVSALHSLPDHVSDDVAVAMIGTGRTAMGVFEAAAFRPDDTVLVLAAAGGIGALAVQEAHAVGARVIGAAGGAAKVDLVRSLGADLAVDYREPGWDKGIEGVTVVLDAVGGAAGRTAFELLVPGGRVVLFGWALGTEPTKFTSDELFARTLSASVALGPRLFPRLREFEELSLAAAASGRLTPVVSSTFPLADAARAHRALENRETVGKVVLKP
ncbi:zinc-binding dehydrogenase [Umezawaea endophytica]|uniref:Zinc-binding dehydrogenase n=1 Tax=Umezawaea endophytica TaxID=1654476 RepID=A0A9X2VS14_9PSEU|nr:zinc-binding dehydrogenase [Umezawaea endophytica]MCS7481833.1 zinc-binding dehydrogenase [Umezawaea endophytica]